MGEGPSCGCFLWELGPHARGRGILSHLSILRGVSIAKGAGDHQDQGFVLQVYNVVLLHGHCLGGQGHGRGKKR